MFESDDYDQALSQLDFPEELNIVSPEKESTISNNPNETNTPTPVAKNSQIAFERPNNYEYPNKENFGHANPSKRVLLDTHFDHKRKRKFPGPAGLLAGKLEKTKEESYSHIELLSQDVDFTPNNLFTDVLETPLWRRLLEDTRNLKDINTISSIKEQGFHSKLRSKKANTVIAVVEAIDRFGTDPLITLSDSTGQIKCTLHRDAWKSLSVFIVSQYCAFVLSRPTIFTTGNTLKKHYLNITLRNISKIYSSTVIRDKDDLPDGFEMSCEESFTIISATDSGSVSNISSNFEDVCSELDDLEGAFTEDM
ncbi:uncharacterized protein LOC121735602 [Aricia agestis]|uniref:uncharacterized protein LOC121735602 n=1 Tax=Aricia agestis TaxID=91739 RepID=UPI001C204C8B|nr:uncharacterized protein LOC121735602 [Aricia agestis]